MLCPNTNTFCWTSSDLSYLAFLLRYQLLLRCKWPIRRAWCVNACDCSENKPCRIWYESTTISDTGNCFCSKLIFWLNHNVTVHACSNVWMMTRIITWEYTWNVTPKRWIESCQGSNYHDDETPFTMAIGALWTSCIRNFYVLCPHRHITTARVPCKELFTE